MNRRNIFVRVVAIILCAVMLLGVVTAALYAFAADAETVVAALPDTGSTSMVWVIVAAIAAVAVIAACMIVPKIKKK